MRYLYYNNLKEKTLYSDFDNCWEYRKLESVLPLVKARTIQIIYANYNLLCIHKKDKKSKGPNFKEKHIPTKRIMLWHFILVQGQETLAPSQRVRRT